MTMCFDPIRLVAFKEGGLFIVSELIPHAVGGYWFLMAISNNNKV